MLTELGITKALVGVQLSEQASSYRGLDRQPTRTAIPKVRLPAEPTASR